MNILVTGANGQLGQCFQSIVKLNGNGEPKHFVHDKNYWIFAGHNELDITNKDAVDKYFHDNNINVVVNCAAYTNVDKAEEDEENAYKINVLGAENLAIACNKYGAIIIHISTDYVFDGTANTPRKPDDDTYALGAYGRTKLEGEKLIQKSGCKYLIFRTSWLYSRFGNNFVKKMAKKIMNNEDIKVVYDQVGSPTSAYGLALFIYLKIEKNNSDNRYLFKTGIYHYADKGVASWYDLTYYISQLFPESKSSIFLCCSSEFPTKAQRPSYSVLDTRLTEKTFNYQISNWMDNVSEEIIYIKEELKNESC